jgi:multiple sugar transport system ATP-binding protein
MADVRFEHVYKFFGPHPVVEDLCLEIADGEFLVLLGPSGCGKTTSLRMLAGLERPTYGRIEIGGRTVNALPPKARDVAMVFQSYALFPHMTVRGNLSFGLKVRHVPSAQIRRQVHELAAMLGIERLLDKRPAQLSGGECQRVALGRAMLRRPRVFLMDEPLSNLDASLRAQMRSELILLHAKLNATMVYVTHDQAEAMTMANRIGVMCKGHLVQVDTPQQIYDNPTTLFVACFVGMPKMNIVPARLIADRDEPIIEMLGTRIVLNRHALRHSDLGGQSDVLAGIRAEDVLPESSQSNLATVDCCVELVEPLGSETLVTSRCSEGTTLVGRFPARSPIATHERIRLGINARHLHLFDAVTEDSLFESGPPRANVSSHEVSAP